MSGRVKPSCSTCDTYGDDRPKPCHPCGHMPNGAVLPGCYGTAVSARTERDLSFCHCVRPQEKDVLAARVEELEGRIAALEAR